MGGFLQLAFLRDEKIPGARTARTARTQHARLIFFPLGGFNVFQVSTHPNYINIIYTVKSTVGWNGMDHPRMNGNLSSLSNIKTTSR